ncbi:MAG: DUF721 domain-containing protein [Fimbriimonadales bacterium]|nr:DUF721 domain-containing protein [Fimbriimonadales bacterium]
MQQVGNALRKLLHRLGLDKQLRTYDALAHWSDIVGKQVAQVARPLRVDTDTLWVAVKSHVWAQELNFQKGVILTRLNERAGEERFKEIRFVVRASLPPGVVVGGDADAKGGSKPVGGDADAMRGMHVASASPPTISETELAQIESSLAGVSDPVLRDALKRAQLATLRYQKYLAQRGWRRCVVCDCYHSDDSPICFLCEQGV